MNLVSKPKPSRVHVTQQAVAQRGFALDQALDFAMIELIPRNRLQHAHIVNPVGGNFPGREHLRHAEKISLEIKKARLTRGEEFLAGFHFFGQHAAAPRSVAVHDFCALLNRSAAEIHLDNVRHFG
jgi:hypothetical protein